MHPEIAKRIGVPIPAVAEGADFSPVHNGEEYVVLTFRVPKDTPAIAGVWSLTPKGPRDPGMCPWAIQKHPDATE